MNLTPDQKRVWERVIPEPNSGCWLWLKSVNPDGYATIGAYGKLFRAHRFAYEAWRGPIPQGLTIDHLCRVRSCCNPAHMEAVTIQVNVMRGTGMAVRNLAKTHCPHGHEYDHVVTWTDKPWRRCSVCVRVQGKLKMREYRARKKEGK